MSVSVSTSSTLNFEELVSPDHLAVIIAQKWRDLNNYRLKWVEEKKELRNYLFATDTRTTSNDKLPWKNSTTTPKLTQIRDNLHANYMATLFPNSDWLDWRASNDKSDTKEKRRWIKGFVKNKVEHSNFLNTASKLVTDYIDYGNTFGIVEHVNQTVVLEDGDVLTGYVGPILRRISPLDIVFDPTSSTFEESPKIIKKIVDLGDIAKAITDDPIKNANLSIVFDKMVNVRNIIRSSDSEIHKSEGFVADGFSNITHYYESNYVELLTFYGNLFNTETGELHSNRQITIADRSFIIENIPIKSWLGRSSIHHVGWRDRPDNLYAMGPLDNLVGLQYRIDHLENMKADVWDQVSWPTKIISGEVEDFSDEPGTRIYTGDEGSVTHLAPDVTALNADPQIDRIIFLMEEMAGAPRQAMGFRTPGEKTAFEVDKLENAANRIFRHKTSHMERVFFEPILNDYLEIGRRNLPTVETIETVDSEDGIAGFEQITREDITAQGKLSPIGARHFAERNTRLQNLQQFLNIKIADPSVGVHLSGKKLAEIMTEELNEPSLFEENIGITEQMETASVQENAAVDFQSQQEDLARKGL